MNAVHTVINSLTHLFFPQVCAGCGNDYINSQQLLCLQCMEQLPLTNYQLYPNNPVEKIFYGRCDIVYASSHYYFTKNSILQHLLHQFKYKGKQHIGLYFGQIMGRALKQSDRFHDIDAVVPLPLFATKEKKRGYNQAKVLCDGISSVMNIPVLKNAVNRVMATDTQTRKNRIERWENISGKFEVESKELLVDKHVLLVDDVVTTGATLDACANELLKVEGLLVSIATLAFTMS